VGGFLKNNFFLYLFVELIMFCNVEGKWREIGSGVKKWEEDKRKRNFECSIFNYGA
jgi:hypothetical protein